MKNTLINILKFVISLGVGVFLIWFFSKDLSDEQIDDILNSFRTADYKWLVLSLIFGFLSHLSRGIRWTILLEPLGHKPKVANSFYAVMIGYLANLAFPRLGEVTRSGALRNSDGVPFTAAFGTVVAERVIDLFILLTLTVAVVASQFGLLSEFIETQFLSKLTEKLNESQGKFQTYAIIGGIALIALIALLFILRSKAKKVYEKVKGILKSFGEGLVTVKNVKRRGAFIFHTLFIWTMYVLMSYVCFFALEETAGLSPMAVLACFVFGSFGIVLVQGGLGAYPVIVMMTLELYGISKETGLAFGWLVWTAQTLLILALGFASLILMSMTNKKTPENEQATLANTEG